MAESAERRRRRVIVDDERCDSRLAVARPNAQVTWIKLIDLRSVYTISRRPRSGFLSNGVMKADFNVDGT